MVTWWFCHLEWPSVSSTKTPPQPTLLRAPPLAARRTKVRSTGNESPQAQKLPVLHSRFQKCHTKYYRDRIKWDPCHPCQIIKRCPATRSRCLIPFPCPRCLPFPPAAAISSGPTRYVWFFVISCQKRSHDYHPPNMICSSKECLLLWWSDPQECTICIPEADR